MKLLLGFFLGIAITGAVAAAAVTVTSSTVSVSCNSDGTINVWTVPKK